jgi:hypothetical protein
MLPLPAADAVSGFGTSGTSKVFIKIVTGTDFRMDAPASEAVIIHKQTYEYAA